MPDFERVVRDRLGAQGVLDDEVTAELAAHMEMFYEEQVAAGMPEEQALAQSLGQVQDWVKLRKELIRMKSGVSERTRKLWAPGFACFVLAMFSQQCTAWAGLKPHTAFIGTRGLYFQFSPVWLMALPFFGALAAYLSKRAGGQLRTMILAATFPAWLPGFAFLAAFPLTVAMQLFVGSSDLKLMASSFSTTMVSVVIIPGIAMSLGVVPFMGAGTRVRVQP